MCSPPQDPSQLTSQLSQLDLTLRQLIESASQLPLNSPERRRLVNRLLTLLLNCGEIKPEGDEIYVQALLETQKWFSRNFHRFDPAAARDPDTATVLGWFKQHLSYRLKHPRPAIGPIQLGQYRRIEAVQSANSPTAVWDLLLPETDNSAEADLLRRERVAAIRGCVESCMVLRSKSVPNRPDLHCQRLLLLLLPRWESSGWVEGWGWDDLSAEFGVARKQLIACYNKHLHQSCQNCLANCCRRKFKDS